MPTIFALAALCATQTTEAAGAPVEHFPLAPESEQRAKGVTAGETLSFEWNDSQIFPGTRRKIRVYVPHAYDGQTPACVAVFQDGGGYRFETVFDNLIHTGEMPVTIGVVVPPGRVPGAVDASGTRHNRTFEYDSPGDRYARFLLGEILPAVEKLRTADGRPVRLSPNGNDRMIAGGSSGAAAAFNAAWAMPEAFSRVFSAIGSYTGLRGSHIYPTLVHKTEPKALRLFLQSGEHDMWTAFGDWWSANNAMVRALGYAGYEFEHEFGDGRHSPAHGTALFPRALRYLWKDWPAPVRAGAGSRNHVLKHTVFQDKRWETAGELPLGTEWHTRAHAGAFAKIRADKNGALWAAVHHIVRPHLPPDTIIPLTNPPDPKYRPKVFWNTYRRAADGAWQLEGNDEQFLAFDRDGVSRLILVPSSKIADAAMSAYTAVSGTTRTARRIRVHDNYLVRIAPDGARARLADSQPMRSVYSFGRSLVVTPSGDIYVAPASGDKITLFREGRPAREIQALRLRATSIGSPRTLALTCDGNWLAGFEGGITRGKSWRIEKNGDLAFGQSFYVLHKRDEDDGAAALDAAAEASDMGYLYIATALGVQILDANGRTGAILPLPGGTAAISLCFGGTDFKTLYALGADGKIYSRPMKNPGALPWRPPAPIKQRAG
ncbi:MAG: hypothetical protein LBI02_01455 [Opitutaceae bacterium]|nr:hypothetical protein [Opitutaceae bacterium]